MTKEEFLTGLRNALSGTGSEQLITENLRYYDQYIESEKQKGRSEEEVLSELGDPRLIAKSIMDAGGYEEGFSDANTEGGTGGNATGGASYGESTDRDPDDDSGTGRVHNPHGASFFVVPIVVLVLIVVLLIMVIAGIVTILSPVLVPLLIMILIIWFFRNITG